MLAKVCCIYTVYSQILVQSCVGDCPPRSYEGVIFWPDFLEDRPIHLTVGVRYNARRRATPIATRPLEFGESFEVFLAPMCGPEDALNNYRNPHNRSPTKFGEKMQKFAKADIAIVKGGRELCVSKENRQD